MPSTSKEKAQAYVDERGLEAQMRSALSACINAQAADPLTYLVEHVAEQAAAADRVAGPWRQAKQVRKQVGVVVHGAEGLPPGLFYR